MAVADNESGLLSRLWTLPVHRVSALTGRLTAEAAQALTGSIAITAVGVANATDCSTVGARTARGVRPDRGARVPPRRRIRGVIRGGRAVPVPASDHGCLFGATRQLRATVVGCRRVAQSHGHDAHLARSVRIDTVTPRGADAGVARAIVLDTDAWRSWPAGYCSGRSITRSR